MPPGSRVRRWTPQTRPTAKQQLTTDGRPYGDSLANDARASSMREIVALMAGITQAGCHLEAARKARPVGRMPGARFSSSSAEAQKNKWL